MTITVTDDGNPALNDTITFTWTITPPNQAPAINPVLDRTNQAGVPITPLQIVATDPDAGDTLTFTETGLPNGLTIDANGIITGTPTFTTGLAETLTITVTDDGNPALETTVTFDWTITPAVPPTTTTTTTVAPTSTTTTTVAPTTTTTTTAPAIAPSTLAPTTAPSTTTAAPTTTAAANRPTLEEVPPAPDALPFTNVLATSDRFAATEQVTIIDVLANDSYGSNGRISNITQPAVGSVAIINGQLEITMPPSYSGTTSFTYTLTDDTGTTSQTTVEIVGANVLSALTQTTNETEEAPTFTEAVFARTSALFTGLVSIRLTTNQLSLLATGPLFLGLLRLAVVKRDYLLAVTSSSRAHPVSAPLNGTDDYELRHDAYLWTKGRLRTHKGTRQIQVELPNGKRSWIDRSLTTEIHY